MFFLWLVVGFLLVFALFVNLSLKLEFKNFVISFPKKENKKNSDKGIVKLKIYLFKKIKIASIDLEKVKSEKVKFKQILSLFKKYREKGNTINLDIKTVIKKLNIRIEKLSVEMVVGIGNAATTAIVIGFFYTILENIIITKVKKEKQYECNIKPSYNKEMLFVKFDGIFEINVWNIINIIFKELKRRVKKNGRTSNRTTYVYSNE